MQEMRRAIRYVPGEDADVSIALHRPQGDIAAALANLSTGGMAILVTNADGRAIEVGDKIDGDITVSGKQLPWNGHVAYRTENSRPRYFGIAAGSEAMPTLQAAANWLAEQPRSGALHLQHDEDKLRLSVIGRLSFMLNRDFIDMLRHPSIEIIDLSRCHSVDSSGLGALCLARDMKVPIVGASEPLASLLHAAGIVDLFHLSDSPG